MRVIDHRPQVLRGLGGVRCKRQGRNHRNAIGAGRDHIGGIGGIDPGNRANRQVRLSCTDRVHDRPQAVGADRRLRIVLRGGAVDAADRDIVEQLERRGLGLFHRLDAQADDRTAAEQQPRIGHRHVVLADVHAVGFGGERDVDAIIDQQRDTLRLSTARRSRASSIIGRVVPCLSRSCTKVALAVRRRARSTNVRPPATAGSTSA